MSAPSALPPLAPTPSQPAPVADGPPFAKTRYTGAVMVCGKCQKRDSGPSKLKAKELRHDFRQALGDARHRLRIVQTSCLGLCPKKAIAVAAVVSDGPALLAAVQDTQDVRTVAERLANAPAPRC